MNAFTSPDNLRYYLEQLVIQMQNGGLEGTVKQYHHDSLKYLLEKQRQYSGAEYLDQLERNAVYLGEAGRYVILNSAEFLAYGEPILPASQIAGYVANLRATPHTEAPYHVKFVREGCSGCSAHDHARWQYLKDSRRTSSRGDYIEELEFSVVYYQNRFRLVQTFMMCLLEQHAWAGAASALSTGQIAEVIENRLNPRLVVFTNLNVQPEQAERAQKTSTGKLPWRFFWGAEFDQLARGPR